MRYELVAVKDKNRRGYKLIRAQDFSLGSHELYKGTTSEAPQPVIEVRSEPKDEPKDEPKAQSKKMAASKPAVQKKE